MKKFISVFLTLTILASMITSFSVTTSATNYSYVESFQFGVSNNNNTAKSCAKKNSYSLVSNDEVARIHMNKNLIAYLGQNFTYLAYKGTNNIDDAIRDIIAVTDASYKDKYELYNVHNGCTYYSVGGYFNNDYYKQIGGDTVYLYVTKDKRAGTPITSVVLSLYNPSKDCNVCLHKYDENTEEYSNISVNYNSGSSIYLCYNQDTPYYVSALQLGADYYKDDAKKHAQYNFDSSTLVDVDLNKGCGTSSDYIYVAYQTTKSAYLAIRDIICLSGKEYGTVASWINTANGCTYYPVGGYDDDLNKHNVLNVNDNGDGEYLYLFYTCDVNAGEALIGLTAIDQGDEYTGKDAVKFNNGDNANLNKDAGGKYIYLLRHVYNEKTYSSSIDYVSELQLGADYVYFTAKKHAELNFDGCTLVDVDLNDGCGSSSDYIYIAYKTTKSERSAIRDIICVSGEEYGCLNYFYNSSNGCTYYPVGGYDDDANLHEVLNVNDDGDGEYLYLFYTRDIRAGEPLVGLSGISQDDEYKGTDAVTFNNGTNANLNNGTDGYKVYLLCNFDTANSYNASMMNENASIYYVIAGAVIIIGTGIGLFFTKKYKAIVID